MGARRTEGGEEWVCGRGDGQGGRCAQRERGVVGQGADELHGAEFRVGGSRVKGILADGPGRDIEGEVGVARAGVGVMGLNMEDI